MAIGIGDERFSLLTRFSRVAFDRSVRLVQFRRVEADQPHALIVAVNDAD